MHVEQQSHQFGDGDRGMRIVELDGGLLVQIAHIAEALDVTADEILQRSRGEEIFLPQAQLLTGRIGIRRIENARNTFRARAFQDRADMVAGVECVELDSLDRLCAPQAQRVHGVAAPADDGRVIGDCQHFLGGLPGVAFRAVPAGFARYFAAEADLVHDLAALEFPRVAE